MVDDIVEVIIEAYMRMGLLRVIENKERAWELINELKRATQLNPLDADAHFDLASIYCAMGNDALYIKELEEVLRIDPNDARVCFALGLMYSSERKSEAINRLHRFIEIAPHQGYAPYIRAAKFMIDKLQSRLPE